MSKSKEEYRREWEQFLTTRREEYVRERAAFLRESPGKTVFDGRVLEIHDADGHVEGYDVQNGGWRGEPPDTWLSELVLGRFRGKRVRVTIEALDAPVKGD